MSNTQVGPPTTTPTARSNFRFAMAQELFDEIPEVTEDITARPDGHSTVDFINQIVKGDIPEEAITFCAYVLPRRFAVWWGHECLKMLDHTLDDHDRDMMVLAADWVGNPEEESRYDALDTAMDAKAKTPGVWIALGAGWSGGSMVGPEMPPVPPAPHLTARAVNAGILSVLARVDVSERAEHLGRFTRMALRLGQDN
ncbi:hypothetical protein [Actibacterium sp. 188UL27-1]|uniref:DUF6931 family protein n=1 Tax=Actibacterium sp. 188UL27-1 TaxID=2786961 RepID=UPI00195E7D47|nr:hypothetical protein [Actibacterium sp. 188UL27-1]MBM7068833.1 hypothetical protein [Actibacterium sp. 188UL27-1]